MPESALLALVAQPLGPEGTRLGADLVRVDAAWHIVSVLAATAFLPTRSVTLIRISIPVLVLLMTVVGWLLSRG